ncbi:MAG: hypothetical protein AAFX57_13575 [Bacteroidota bacterium]
MSLYYLYENDRSLISIATSVADEALLINGAVCIYHTFEMVGNVPAGSPVRNIRTPIGGHRQVIPLQTPAAPLVTLKSIHLFYNLLSL